MTRPIPMEVIKDINNSIQPIAIDGFCDRYSIDIRIGTIYDYELFLEITPDLVNDTLMVTLENDKHKKHTFALCDILIRMIFGYTNSTFRPKMIEFPCNTSILMPRVHKLIEMDDRRIEINDIMYYRWFDSEIFISQYGVVYSVPYGAFLRQYYTDRGYKCISQKENGITKKYRVHHLVWESYYNKPIPEDKEIDHMNNRRWDNSISNLQLLTHLENLQKKNPESYKTYSKEVIINIANDLLNGLSTKEISEKYSISRARVWEIKFHDMYKDILAEADIDLSDVDRDRRTSVTKNDIRDIFMLRENGMSVKEIADKYNVSSPFIYQIFSGRAFSEAS